MSQVQETSSCYCNQLLIANLLATLQLTMTKPFEDRQTSIDQLTIVETYDEYSSNDSDDEALRTKRAKK